MRILKPGEPCPCCGTPIRDDLPRWKLLLLSYIAEGLSLMDAIGAMAEVMEVPSCDNDLPKRSEYPISIPSEAEAVTCKEEKSEAETKKCIFDRLRQYRKDHGLGCLDLVASKTAHLKKNRLSADMLRAALDGEKLTVVDWLKIEKALDELEKEDNNETAASGGVEDA